MRGAICVGILRKRWSWCVVWYLADVCWCWRGQDALEEANEAAWDTMLSTAVVVRLGVPKRPRECRMSGLCPSGKVCKLYDTDFCWRMIS